MLKILLFAFVLAGVVIAVWFVQDRKSVRSEGGLELVRKARQDDARQMFFSIGAHWPPRGLFLRGFKQEGELELWEGPPGKVGWVRVAIFPVLGRSGDLGPKRREGDRQVPEGAYVIDRMNPRSSYHLSLGLNYPNESDRVRSDSSQPGSDIFIHGGSATIGCLPIGDEAIELLYLAVAEVFPQPGASVAVHLFPFRMSAGRVASASREYPEHAAFWRELAALYEAFEDSRVPPDVLFDSETGRLVKPGA